MRKDGRPIKPENNMFKVAMHIMTERTDAMNMVELDIRNEPLHQYINRKKKEDIKISQLAIFIATYVRVISQCPALNRFIVNKHMYARNDISVGMVVLKPGETDGTVSKMYFKPEMTIFDVQKILDDYIEVNKQEGKTNATDKMICKLLKVPGLCRLAISSAKWLDKRNMLPKHVIEASPFHCGMTITNMATVGAAQLYHHLYSFGTISISMAMGNPKEVPVKQQGTIEFERCIPLCIVIDERIASRTQYSNAFKLMLKYLKCPELLELPPEEIIYEGK